MVLDCSEEIYTGMPHLRFSIKSAQLEVFPGQVIHYVDYVNTLCMTQEMPYNYG